MAEISHIRPPLPIHIPEPAKVTMRSPLKIDLQEAIPHFAIGPDPEMAEPYSTNGDRVVEVKEQIREIRTAIHNLQSTGILEILLPPPPDCQQIRFGLPRKPTTKENRGNATYRGYMLIEPESVYDAMQRLFYVGERRIKRGERVEFKWHQPTENSQGRGSHKDHYFTCGYVSTDHDQLITLYGESTHEIQDIFKELTQSEIWRPVEQKRREVAKQLAPHNKPMKGECQYMSPDGMRWTTLEYNMLPGTQSAVYELRKKQTKDLSLT